MTDAEMVEVPQSQPMALSGPVTVESMMLAALQSDRVDALDKLLVARAREQDREAKQAYVAAMVATQAAIEPVARKAWNEQTKSWYAKYDAVYRAAIPTARRNDLVLSFGTEDSPMPEHVRIVCDVMHKGGHSERYRVDLAVDNKGIQGKTNKTLIHGEGSTMTYGQRYLTCMIFNVLLGDDTDGNKGSGNITPEHITELTTLLNQAKPDMQKFWAFCKSDALEDLSEADYRRVAKMLQQKIERDKGAA